MPNLTTFWSRIDELGADLGPGDGMKYLPLQLAVPMSREPNTLGR